MNRSFGEGLAHPLGFVAEVFRRDRVLAWTGALMLLQAVAALALMPLDHRTILGLDPWIKPFKFSVSIAIFLWTVAWILPTLRASRRVKSFFSWGFAICMVVEIACIAGQSARGVRSHFNFETGFDSTVFGTMGTMIGVNSMLLAALLLLFVVCGADLAPSCLWAVRLGLLVTLLGSAQGGLIVAHGQHAVGVADGGEGLPLVNWSTEGGDLRVAHMIGLHGMQIVPLFALLLGRMKPRWTERRRIGWVVAFSTIYAAAGGVLLVHALSGRPVFPQRLGGLCPGPRDPGGASASVLLAANSHREIVPESASARPARAPVSTFVWGLASVSQFATDPPLTSVSGSELALASGSQSATAPPLASASQSATVPPMARSACALVSPSALRSAWAFASASASPSSSASASEAACQSSCFVAAVGASPSFRSALLRPPLRSHSLRRKRPPTG